MGSKNRIANEILPIILKDRKIGQYYVEPFCGGCNVIDKVNGNRIASDNNEYLIELFIKLQNGYKPIDFINRDEYYNIKNNKHLYPKEVVALCGVLASYNGNWFRSYGGYSKTKTGNDRNFYKEGVINLMNKVKLIKEIKFYCSDYFNLDIPFDSIIYCDPPYKNTDETYLHKNFDSEKFFEWCRLMKFLGNKIFISEFNAPYDFKCIWSKEIQITHANQKNKSVEKLYTL